MLVPIIDDVGSLSSGSVPAATGHSISLAFELAAKPTSSFAVHPQRATWAPRIVQRTDFS